MAAQKHPAEALHWDEGTIGDTAAHYEYLMEHEEITRRLAGLVASGSTRH